MMTNKLLTKNSTLVHEANYARLLYVIPEIKSICSRVLIRSQTNNHKIEINARPNLGLGYVSCCSSYS